MIDYSYVDNCDCDVCNHLYAELENGIRYIPFDESAQLKLF